MEVLRTPDERFEKLPDYPFEPNWVEVEGIDIHYVDEGPADADPVLMLHGEPSWSYLYRRVIPAIAAAGLRAIAPDLVGFGRSDKPTRVEDYTYQRHLDWTLEFVESLELENITLVCQPFLTAFSDSDPITRGAEQLLQSDIPGARDQSHPTITGAGHFLQEDCGPALARVVLDFIART